LAGIVSTLALIDPAPMCQKFHAPATAVVLVPDDNVLGIKITVPVPFVTVVLAFVSRVRV
jgi:hypothetical protein